MLDINLIRNKPEWVKEQVANRNDSAPIDEILATDVRRREILGEVEGLRQERNVASKAIGRTIGQLKKAQKKGNADEVARLTAAAEAAKARPREIGSRISEFTPTPAAEVARTSLTWPNFISNVLKVTIAITICLQIGRAHV